MPDNPPSLADIQARLHEVAHLLRDSRTMDLEPRQVLAELIDELSTALKSAQLPSDEVTHLAGTTMHLAEALHHQHDKGMLEKVRDRFEDATAQAEARAPVAVGLARRVLDALAQMGI